MAKFIEIEPFENGKTQPKMLINTEKIDYIQQVEYMGSLIFLNDVPCSKYTKKPLFDSPLYVERPFMSIAKEITEVTDEQSNQKNQSLG